MTEAFRIFITSRVNGRVRFYRFQNLLNIPTVSNLFCKKPSPKLKLYCRYLEMENHGPVTRVRRRLDERRNGPRRDRSFLIT